MKITIKDISLKNFLSIGNNPIKIEFQEGIYRVKGENLDTQDANGVGKSAIFVDGLMFPLFGKTVRTINKGDICNTINEKKGCETSINFQVGTKNYTIIRNIKPDKLLLLKEGEPLLEKCSNRLIQEEINKILGADYTTFIHILIMSKSYTTPFLDMSSPEKRGIIEDILGVNIFGKMRDHIKKEIEKDLNAELKIKKLEYDSGSETLTELQERNDNIKNKVSKLKKERKEKLTNIKDKIEKAVSTVDTYDEYIIDTNNIQKKITKLKTHRKKLIDDKNELISENKSLEKNSLNIDRKLSKLIESPVCPLCNTETNSEHIEEHINDMKSEIESNATTCQSNKIEISKNNSTIEQVDEKIEEYSDKISNSNKYVSKKELLLERIEELKEQYEQLKNKKEDFEELVDDDSIDRKKKELDAIEADLNDLSKEKRYYDYIKNLLSEEGIKNYIIKSILPYWNKKVNTYLKEVNADFTIEFDNQLNAIINSRGYDPLTYHSYSGGEKARIDFAILMSILDLSSLRSSIDLNITILDELLDGSGLSTNGKEDVLKLLHDKSIEENKSIYVISHHDTLSVDLFTDDIHLIKKDGFTELVDK